MGRMLETLRQLGAKRGIPAEAPRPTPTEPVAETEPEDIPFIEVGGKKTPVEGSPDVLAYPTPRPLALPLSPPTVSVPQIATPIADEPETPRLSVIFRPIIAEPRPAHARFATELIAFHKPEHPQSKQYQSLAATLAGQLPALRSRALLFAAAHPGAGVTTVLLNLAITFARQGKQRVLAVDANVNQPAIAERFGLPEVPGLADVLAGGLTLQDVVQETGQANLLALTAGLSRGLRLNAETMRALLRQLRERFDLILLDAPAWSAQAGWLPLALLCEAVYLVSPENEAQDAETACLLETMTRQGVPVRGHLVTAR